MTIAFCFLSFLYSNKFEVNFYKALLIIICKHLEIYAKTISRFRFGDYNPTFGITFLLITSPSGTNC